MKFITAAIVALFAVAEVEAIAVNKPSVRVSGEEGIYRPRPYTYTYNDIRDKEFKCLSGDNREWHYDANNNTWECPLKSPPSSRYRLCYRDRVDPSLPDCRKVFGGSCFSFFFLKNTH